jgi:small subunit ribosomal protein S6
MPRPYEVVYIFDSALEDAAITDKLTRFHNLLGAHGTPPADLKVDTWGRRQLAYTIGPRETGYYVVARFSAEPPTLPEFRYLVSLHEHEVGAPPMSEEEMVAARRREDDEDDEE